MKTRIHPETGALLTKGIRIIPIRMEYLPGTLYPVEVSGWFPEDASDYIADPVGVAAISAAQNKLRDTFIERVRELRNRHGLTQEAAGEIFGGGPRAFQKYESGAQFPRKAAALLLDLLWRHPDHAETIINRATEEAVA